MVASRFGDNPRFSASGVYLRMKRGGLGENLEVCSLTDKLQRIHQDVASCLVWLDLGLDLDVQKLGFAGAEPCLKLQWLMWLVTLRGRP
jgi:hypothetical protein